MLRNQTGRNCRGDYLGGLDAHQLRHVRLSCGVPVMVDPLAELLALTIFTLALSAVW